MINDILRGGKVECYLCLEPHFKNESWDEVESCTVGGGKDRNNGSGTGTDGVFLRRRGGRKYRLRPLQDLSQQVVLFQYTSAPPFVYSGEH